MHVRKIALLGVVLRLCLAPHSGSQERELTILLGQGNYFLGLWMKLLHNVNMSGGTSGGVQMYHDFLAHSTGVAGMQVDVQIVGFSFVMIIVHVFADTTDIWGKQNPPLQTLTQPL